jgi:non-homologous end joining protein Ku
LHILVASRPAGTRWPAISQVGAADLLKKKEAGEKIQPAKAGPAPRVVNLMEALRASLDTAKKKAPAPSVQGRRPTKKKVSRK